MASALYDRGREGFLDGSIDWDTDDIREIYIDSADYTFSAAHDFLDDVAGAARVHVSGSLSGKTVTNGVADATDTVHSGVTGDQFEAIILYKHTGVDATSRLICFIDGFAATTPNGGAITTVYDNGANKIFKL